MQQFNSDKEIREYIEKSIDDISLLEECRLYREEQYQITEEVMKSRNSTEWLIRINKVIKNCVYAIIKSYEYAKLMEWPLEETENSQMYSFYLEDAVYRSIVLWDMLRQFLNEFYECGYSKDEEVSIFSFLNNLQVRRKIGSSNVRRLKRYLNSTEHQEVRTYLRNSFTHSLDTTSSYLFHRVNDDGLLQADMSNALPRHPYENIVYVLDDLKKYLKFANTYVGRLEDFLIKESMIVTIDCNLKCGEIKKDTEKWSISVLREKAEQILCPCDKSCDYAIQLEGVMVCKPISISYCRINEDEEKYKGKIDLKMDYEEMERCFGNRLTN